MRFTSIIYTLFASAAIAAPTPNFNAIQAVQGLSAKDQAAWIALNEIDRRLDLGQPIDTIVRSFQDLPDIIGLVNGIAGSPSDNPGGGELLKGLLSSLTSGSGGAGGGLSGLLGSLGGGATGGGGGLGGLGSLLGGGATGGGGGLASLLGGLGGASSGGAKAGADALSSIFGSLG